MFERFTNTQETEDAAGRIRQLLDAHHEWFLSAGHGDARATALTKDEFDISVAQGRLIFSYWGDAGALLWRIAGWEWTGEKLLLEATRNFGREAAVLELVPRASAKASAAVISATRRARCERLAKLGAMQIAGAQIEKARLSAGVRRDEPGRYARIVLNTRRERLAVTGIVTESGAGDADAFLSTALLWFLRVRERSGGASRLRTEKLWLACGRECLAAVRQRVALLREDLRRTISLYEIHDDWQRLAPVPQLTAEELWLPQRAFVRRSLSGEQFGEFAEEVRALMPEAFDVVRGRRGETLRYHGLAFARVRRLMSREHVWFGTEKARRRLLDDTTREEWFKLLGDLREHRRANAGDHRHALYRAAPEAWLESLLRRDITRLDPGLIVAPLHAQFRATPTNDERANGIDLHHNAARPVDLLALRRDGRLVVIELKVSEDREIVFQGVDYWRRVSAYHRAGHIERARLFGDAEISDEPPLVYLVAPLLRYHRAFDTLARAISPEIEMYRFDINEDWRTGVRVTRRTRVS
ncbi:MAG: hypothetical protein ABR577_09015 [Pyrinomonadaceae bacterium]